MEHTVSVPESIIDISNALGDNFSVFSMSGNHSHHYHSISNDEIFFDEATRDSLYLVVPITVIYVVIFIIGCIGNISTCIVIAKNKSMYSATNYYLFSLAISDFMLLISGVPMELYHIWFKNEFIFGEYFCILRNMINEMSANATVLTITAFTIERYFAICHPFLSHTMSKLSRAVKYIFLIWILSISFAVPQALQTGLIENENGCWCSVIDEKVLIKHSFELATLLFFFAPMSLITVLYILIGVKLRSSTMIKRENGSTVQRNNLTANIHHSHSTSQSSKRVIKMLVAVVICFFLCWAPFHAQRLVFVWAMKYMNNPLIHDIFVFTTYASGILYYVSTCINPILYNLMSNKFRQAFKKTLQEKCCNRIESPTHSQKHEYRVLSRTKRHFVQHESSEYSGSGRDDYSSSTHKQSVDCSLTMSRDTSLKHLKFSKDKFTDNNINNNNNYNVGMSRIWNSAAFKQHYVIGERDEILQSQLLTAKITNSQIKVVSEGANINEIRLNIFPQKPSNSITETTNVVNSFDENSARQLTIDVHEAPLNKGVTMSSSNNTESGRKMSSEFFSYVAFKKSDSLLHITIGTTSKVKKRRKLSWMYANRMWKLSKHKKFDCKYLYDLGKCESHNFDGNGKLNITNDEMTVAIHKSSSSSHGSSTICNGRNSHTSTQTIQSKERDFLENDDIENGANELDFYMSQIKKREMRRQI